MYEFGVVDMDFYFCFGCCCVKGVGGECEECVEFFVIVDLEDVVGFVIDLDECRVECVIRIVFECVDGVLVDLCGYLGL